MLDYGIGYVSFDLMRGGDAYYIIEINITNVSRVFWLQNLSPYIENLADGIASLRDKMGRIPVYSKIYDQLEEAGNENEAIGLIPEDRKDEFPSEIKPSEETASFDGILERSEKYSEADKAIMVEGPFEVLCDHLARDVPFYVDGGSPKTKLSEFPVFDLEMVRSNHSELVARPIPMRHGSYHYLTGRLDSERDYSVSWTQFGMTVQNALLRKAMRWAGIDPNSRRINITTTNDAPNQLIDRRLPIGEIATRLNDMTDGAVLISANIAKEFLDELAQSATLQKRVTGVLVDDYVLRGDERETYSAKLNIPIVQILTNPVTGPYAIECPQTGQIHLSSETHLFDVVTQDKGDFVPSDMGELVVTALYNLAQPVTRFRTGHIGRIATQTEFMLGQRTGPIWTLIDQKI